MRKLYMKGNGIDNIQSIQFIVTIVTFVSIIYRGTFLRKSTGRFLFLEQNVSIY